MIFSGKINMPKIREFHKFQLIDSSSKIHPEMIWLGTPLRIVSGIPLLIPSKDPRRDSSRGFSPGVTQGISLGIPPEKLS